MLGLPLPAPNPGLFAAPLAARHTEGPAGAPSFLFCLPVMNPEPPEQPSMWLGARPSSESPGSVKQPNCRAGARGRTSRPLHLPTCLAGNRLVGVSNVRRQCCLSQSLGDNVALQGSSSFPSSSFPHTWMCSWVLGCWKTRRVVIKAVKTELAQDNGCGSVCHREELHFLDLLQETHVPCTLT